MRLRARVLGQVAVVCLIGFAAHRVLAFPEAARETKAACDACHKGVAGGPELTDAGKAWQADKTKVPTGGTANDYIGANKCKTCHSKQYKAWMESKHANAFAVLLKADEKVAAEWAAKMKIELTGSPDKTEGCVNCHVTGRALGGGYPQADSTLMANVSMVGCESCHGPGSVHKSKPKEEKKGTMNGSLTEKMCKTCHTAESSPNFNFEEMKKKVHPVPAE